MTTRNFRMERGETYNDNDPDTACGRKQKRFNAGEMKDDESRPEQENIDETNETEEQRNIDTSLVHDTLLHKHGIEAVEDSAEESHEVTDGQLFGGLVWEGAPILIGAARQIYRRDENDTDYGREHSEKLLDAEMFHSEHCAKEKGPDATGRCQDRGAGDSGEFETCGRKVIGGEP